MRLLTIKFNLVLISSGCIVSLGDNLDQIPVIPISPNAYSILLEDWYESSELILFIVCSNVGVFIIGDYASNSDKSL